MVGICQHQILQTVRDTRDPLWGTLNLLLSLLLLSLLLLLDLHYKLKQNPLVGILHISSINPRTHPTLHDTTPL
ncbi:hypothetical protein M501DRAFT_981 [Patellaria atrata CBS 101060]|uniref:Uncharacterized protein n=1 Tax=Patellaria atrata CBS 101060 TaxID=1346257 RepID=A0A9P4VV28_9PEZI|nr:hypothetical protein M501DRAFT_981 [Patellaria atrata CBS 101060]